MTNEKTDNKLTEESEYIKRISDFACFMAPEYIIGSSNPRSLIIIASDCIDAGSGKHAMAHIMVGSNKVSLCALRSMMEDNDDFARLVHLAYEADGGSESVKDIDQRIGICRRRLRTGYGLAAMTGFLDVLPHWTADLGRGPLVCDCH